MTATDLSSTVPVLQTERLTIRPFVLSDAPFILELLNDKDFIEQIQDRGVRTLDDACGYITDGPMACYERFGIGLCCVLEKSTNEAVGMCGLLQRETLPVPDIGYAFLPKVRRKGYAYEACIEVLDFAGNVRKMQRVLAVTGESNVASQDLLLKLGFRFLEKAQFEPESEAIPCYEFRFEPTISHNQ